MRSHERQCGWVAVAHTLDDLSGPVAKAMNPRTMITVPLPTDRLHDSRV